MDTDPVQIRFGPPADSVRGTFFHTHILQADPRLNISTILLVPSVRKRRQVIAVCADSGCNIPPKILLFDQLAEILYRLSCGTAYKIPSLATVFILDHLVREGRLDAALSRLAVRTVHIGLIQEAAAHIRELIRAGMSADDIAAMPDAVEGYGGLLAAFFREYETEMHRCNWIDSPGMLNAVIGAWDSDPDSFPQNIPFTRLIVDGFIDFTPPQAALLRHLSWRIHTTLVWPGYPDPDSIFAPATAQLQSLFPDAVWEANSVYRKPTHSKWNRPAFPGEKMFIQFLPENMKAASDTSRAGFLKTITADTRREEVARLAKDIRRRLDDPARFFRPDEICVTFPEMRLYVPLVRRMFRRYGIPVNIGQSLPMQFSPLFQTIQRILALPPEFRRRDILALLRDPLIQLPTTGADTDIVDYIDTLSRELKIVRGEENWLKKFRAVRDHGAVPAETAETAAISVRVLEFLFDVVKPLVEPKPFADYLANVRAILAQFAVHQSLADTAELYAENRLPLSAHSEYTIRAYGKILDVFDELTPVLTRLEGKRKISLSTFRVRFQRLFDTVEYQLTTLEDSRVHVLGMQEIRGLTFEIVYVGGLTDRAFPAPKRHSPFWRREIKDIILDQTPNQAEYQANITFYRLLSAARSEIVLSRPLSENDETLLPSRLWSKYVQIVQPDAIDVDRYNDTCAVDRLRSAGKSIAADKPDSIPADSLYRPMLLSAAQFRSMEPERSDRAIRIRSEYLVGQSVRRYLPPNEISVSMIDGFIACPRMFFFRNFLKIDMLEEPEERLMPWEFGSILHRALQRFYAERIQNGQGRIRDGETDSAAQRIYEIARDIYSEAGLETIYSHRELAAIKGYKTTAGLAAMFAESETTVAPELAPVHTEWSFGGRSRNPAFPVRDPDGGMLLLRGVVDRIDRVGNTAVVYDYKTGQVPSASDFRNLATVQIGVYMLAVQKALGLDPAGGCYYSVSLKNGCRIYPRIVREHTAAAALLPHAARWKAMDTAAVDDYFSQLRNRILQIREHLVAGYFPSPENRDACDRCRFRPVCREGGG